MTKKLWLHQPNRRDFLRTGIIGGTGLVVAQFAAPKELRAQTITWTGQVDESSDDAQEFASTGIPNLTATTAAPCNSATYCGFRFSNVTIPNSAAIVAASVSFYVDTAPVAAQCAVYMQYVDDALTFTTNKFNVSRRAKTTHSGVFRAFNTGWQSSTDISAAVQEVVNRQPVMGVGGWQSGNAMAVLTTHPFTDGQGTIRMWDYNPDPPPNYAAILTIQYS